MSEARGVQFIAGDMRLHYLDHGAVSAPVVVLLHGGGLSSRTWDGVCAGLSDQYRCVALDLRGHGDSEWSPNLDYGFDAHLRDLEALVDHIGAQRLFLVGHSLGGGVAVRFAARHADRVAGLVVVDVGPFMPRDSQMAPVLDHVRRSDTFASLDEAVEQAAAFNPRRDRERLRESLPGRLRTLPDGRLTWKHDRRRYADGTYFARTIASFRALVDELPAVTCPTLIVRGGESAFSDDQAAEFAAMLPDGEWAVVPDAGHSVQGDNPSGFVSAVLPFFASR